MILYEADPGILLFMTQSLGPGSVAAGKLLEEMNQQQ